MLLADWLAGMSARHFCHYLKVIITPAHVVSLRLKKVTSGCNKSKCKGLPVEKVLT